MASALWQVTHCSFWKSCRPLVASELVNPEEGGVDETDPLLHPPSGRAFGEDAVLAWAVQDNGGGTAFAPDAVVYHRCIPGTYAEWLREQLHVTRFPALATPEDLLHRLSAAPAP